MHFGATLRLLRVDAGFSVRELARRVGVSSAYLSRVEHGYDAAPTPDRLAAVADVLGVRREALVELARQSGPAVDGYLRRVPAAGALFLEIARRDLDTVQLAQVRAFLDREFPAPSPRAEPRLADRLDASRIVIGFAGNTLRDLVDVAVSRLPEVAGMERRKVAEALMARDGDASSCIGGGVVLPHAVVPGLPDLAVLVTMSRPLPVPTPDDIAPRLGCLVVSQRGGRQHLDVLSRVARLASYGIADELCAAPGPVQVLALLERLEAMW